MTDKAVVADKAFKFKIRCLNIHRKLFRDFQEHEIAPEIKDNCNIFEKKVREENYTEALDYSRKVSYLIQMVHQLGYVPDEVYESLESDGKELSAMIEEYVG